MSKAERTLTFHQGDTWAVLWDCHDGDGQVLPLPSGSVARWRVVSDSEVLLDVVSTDDPALISIFDADGGIVRFMALAEVAAIGPGLYRHELRVEPADGTKSTQSYGPLNVLQSLFAEFP